MDHILKMESIEERADSEMMKDSLMNSFRSNQLGGPPKEEPEGQKLVGAIAAVVVEGKKGEALKFNTSV